MPKPGKIFITPIKSTLLFLIFFIHETTAAQADYLLQRLGGEPYYSKNRGVPALVLAHMHIALTPQVAERWMDHFEEALYDMHEEMAEGDKEMIKDHMRFQAYFLVAAQLLQKEHSAKGVQFLD